MRAYIARVDPDNNFNVLQLLSSDGFPIQPVSSVAGDFAHSQKQWSYNNCGYFSSSNGGEYIALVVSTGYTSANSLYYGTPGAISLIPNYIKITTID
jgi:hypothetical protein